MPKDNKQVHRFIETARMLGCDESEERFDMALRKIAAQKDGAPKRKAKAREEAR